MKINFGEKIREIRHERELSIRDVAEKTGYSSAHITRAELEKRKKLTVDFLFKLAKAYNISLGKIISWYVEDVYNCEASNLATCFPGIEKEKAQKIKSIVNSLKEVESEEVLNFMAKSAEAFRLQEKMEENMTHLNK